MSSPSLQKTDLVPKMFVNLSIQNDRLVATYAPTKKTKELETQSWFFAKIMNAIAYILPSCFIGSAEINVQKKVYYVDRCAINRAFGLGHEDYPCMDPIARHNALELRVIALNYFKNHA